MDLHKANVKHESIRKILLDRITSGQFRVGEKIPSERELCELFSVSRTTVRKALDGLVTAGVVRRIPAKGAFVAQPSPAMDRNTGNIAFIRCYRRNPLASLNEDIFYPRILTGIVTTLSPSNYHCLVQTINENDPSDQMLFQLAEKVDSIICCELRNPLFLERLKGTGLPLVLISPSVVNNTVDTVEIDNRQGAMDAVQYLVELGHRRIGFIGGSPGSRPSKERQGGFIQTLKDNNLPTSPEHIASIGWRQIDGYTAMTRLLNMRPYPTAIFAASDLLALGAYDAAHNEGIRIPEDVSIMGFDDIDMAIQAKPTLSTVLVRKAAIGEQAAQLILERLQGKRDYPVKVVMPTELVERESTALLRVRVRTTD